VPDGCEGYQRGRLCGEWEIIVRTLVFMLSEVGRHWKILRGGA
jgi:hypothetical protein